MPMRWTPENDQRLLLKIIETHILSVDTKKVAQAWEIGANPGEDKPTPRAITERLVRLRQKSNASATGHAQGHLSIGTGSGSATSTPRKTRQPTAATVTTPESWKRKRVVKYEPGLCITNEMDGDGVKDNVEDIGTPTKKPKANVQGSASSYDTSASTGHGRVEVRIGTTLNMGAGDNTQEMSTRKTRSRRPSVFPFGMVNYDAFTTDEENNIEDSSASDYLPDAEGSENMHYA